MKVNEEQLKKLSIEMAENLCEKLTNFQQDFILGCAYDTLSKNGFEPDSDWDEDYLELIQQLTSTIHVISQYHDGPLETADA